MEWYHWLFALIVIVTIIVLALVYWLRYQLTENVKAHGRNPEDIEGYSGGILPWEAISDIQAINEDACEVGYNPQSSPTIDSETGEVIC